MSELKLGRGLQDLLHENELQMSKNEVVQNIEIEKIKPNPDQPRSVFANETLEELASSIKENGLLQPIILKPDRDEFIIVAGERRVRAVKMLGFETISAIVRDYNSVQLAGLALLENLQREDLNPMEEALAYSKLLNTFDITHEELGKKIGKSRTYITNMIGLLNLPAIIIEDVNAGLLTMGHARALSKIKDVSYCIELRDKVISENLTVRELESLIRNKKQEKVFDLIPKTYLSTVKSDLKHHINQDIKFKVNKSSITFKFKTEEELNRIVDYLLSKKGDK